MCGLVRQTGPSCVTTKGEPAEEESNIKGMGTPRLAILWKPIEYR